MGINLREKPSLANVFLAALPASKVQQDSLRFRRNLERIGQVMAYEISQSLNYESGAVETPLGIAEMALPTDRIVLATILRAGLPVHQGLHSFFDRAGNAFVSAYRKHHKDGSFDVHLEYISCPDLEGKVLIVSDAMIATGASMVLVIKELVKYGVPAQIHIATAIASTDGLDYVQRSFPEAQIWTAAVDEELTAKSYIVPGLGDAGDLSYGAKLQD